MGRVLAIDAGTTGVTVLVVDESGSVLGKGYREFAQNFPRPGWVEHEPDAWWDAMLAAVGEALEVSGTRGRSLAALGITNQRETTVVWERATLRSIHPAIVWQDRRSAEACDELRREGWADRIRERTGLVVDPYFSATKLAWLMQN